MRTLLTTFAIALIVVLTAALMAPMFVDWSNWRGAIEAELSQRVGAPVRTSGPIDIRLLPTPYVNVGRVEIGANGAVVCESARFELALMSLTSGRYRFAEIDLDRPQVKIPLGASDVAPWPSEDVTQLLGRVAVDKLVVKGGRATFARPSGAPIVVEGVDLAASAIALNGPFRGSGSATIDGAGRASLEFAAGALSGRELPIKAELKFADSGITAVLDGKLAASPFGKGWRPKFAGAATISGAAPAVDIGGPSPWKASGMLDLDPKQASFDAMNVSLGPELKALEATGSLEASFAGAPSFVVDLTSKQLNVDALLRREGEDAAPPSRAAAVLAAIGRQIAARDAPPFRAKLTFSSPSLFLGASTLEGVSLTAQSEPGEPVKVALETSLPGQGHLKLDGGFDFGAAPKFSGKADVEIGDIGALGEWAAHGDPALAGHTRALALALPYARMSARGDLQASKVGFSLQNLALALDRTRFSGAAAFSLPQGDARGRVYLTLSTDMLDLDEAPDIAGGAFWIGDFDLTLALDASRLRIAHAGQGAVESGSLRLAASREKDRLSLDKLSIADFGGASIEAQGEITPTSRWARVKLDANRLADFAVLASRIAPGRATRLLLARADSLSPARATLEARREGEPKGGPFPLDFLTAEGEAAGTRFALKLNNAPAPVSAIGVDLTLEAPEGGALLKQLGLRAPTESLGRAHVALNAMGDPSAGFEGKASADFAGAQFSASGRYTPDSPDPNAALLFGNIAVKADNVWPALVALRLAPAAAGVAIPVDLAADLVVRGEKVAAPRLSGTLGGAKIGGALEWAPRVSAGTVGSVDPDVAAAQAIAGEAPATGGLSGELSLDKAPLSALLALSFGNLLPAKPGVRWSEAKFGSPAIVPPPGVLALKIATLDLGDAGLARGVEARLKFEPGRFDLDDVALEAGGARLTGHGSLRRDGPTAALSGALDIENLAVDRPAFKGKLGVALDYAGSGASPAALVAGLVGQGKLTLSGGSLARLDPGALDRVLIKADSPDALIDETNVQHSLSLELDKQPLQLADGTAALSMSSGALRAGPIAAQGARVAVSASYDLKLGETTVVAAFSSNKAGKFWSGPPPAFTATVSGPVDAPVRRIDDAGLVAGLAAQAIGRESDRIATLEADIRERAYFNRRMKAEEFLELRRREIAAYQEEQRRLKFEADRQRVEDALMKAYEQKQAAEEQERKRLEAEAKQRAADEERKRLAAEEKKRADAAAAAAAAEAEAEEKKRAAIAAATAAAEEKRRADAAAAAIEEKKRADAAAAAAAAEERKRAAIAAAAAAAEAARKAEPAPPPLPAPLLPPLLPPPAPDAPAQGGLY